jgi:septal ring factor EnvC (AmiA/AmiB activator)
MLLSFSVAPVPLRGMACTMAVMRFLALLLALAAAAPAYAQEPAAAQQLQQLERALEEGRARQLELARQAQRLAAELGTVRAQLVAAANSVQQEEQRVIELRAHLEALRAEETAKSQLLEREQEDLAAVLASLARLSRQPPVAMVTGPNAALDLARSSILLAAIVPGLEARGRAAVAELQSVRTLRERIDTEEDDLAAALQRYESERGRLAALLEQRTREAAQTQTEQQTERTRVATMAAEAADLRELLRKLEGQSNEGPPDGTRPFAEARGRLPLPARGKVIRSWGDLDPLGLPARGLTLEIVAGAQIVAPYDGRIVYADGFRSYGQLLIIDHGGGYHTLVAGLSRIDGQVGQWLLAGEPVGQASHGENGKSTLYIELRRNGEPINPLPWLVAR